MSKVTVRVGVRRTRKLSCRRVRAWQRLVFLLHSAAVRGGSRGGEVGDFGRRAKSEATMTCAVVVRKWPPHLAMLIEWDPMAGIMIRMHHATAACWMIQVELVSKVDHGAIVAKQPRSPPSEGPSLQQ